MSETLSLGRMKRVELRDIWKSEPQGFTPWLARDENLELLADTVGLDLELESQEKGVGPFKADLVCKDTANGTTVLIENQLEKTDHVHLGQLLTYAAGLDAITIVWVAQRFTDEHRAALDWLNEHTAEKISFFGLEIELWQIGDSPVAPKFNIVCKPNDWTKEGAAATSGGGGELTATRKLNLEYWTALRERLLARNSFIKPQRPLPQNWTNFALGRSNLHLVAMVNTRDSRIAAYMTCIGPNAKQHYAALHEQKAAIENDLGEPLVWSELPDRKESQLRIVLENVDVEDRKKWPQQHDWLIGKLEKLHKALRHRVLALPQSTASGDDKD